MSNNSQAPSQRQLAIASEIAKVVSNIFSTNELYHPELEGLILSFPFVKITPDLKIATIYSSCLDREAIENVVIILNKLLPSVKKIVAAKLKLRYMPELKFVADTISEKEIILLKKIDIV